jgi:hypothetical protein
MNESAPSQPYNDDDSIDFNELISRLKRGVPLILGLALAGLAIAAVAYFATGAFQMVNTSTRVVFSFSGFENGEYPDKSKFQADDLRAPEIIAEALKRKGLDSSEAIQSKVRAALTVEGIIPDNIVKERDKLRASGQTPHPYITDEYSLTLSLPRGFQITPREREQLLNEIIRAYQEKFKRTYLSLPLNFGKAFEALEGADYFDYELVLSQESQNITSFLSLMAGTSPRSADNDLATMGGASRTFRSPRTNLSFSDLLKENQLFTQIRLNETLGLIRQNGLSKDRNVALLKMDYYLKTLSDDEHKAEEEEKVVMALLKQSQDRTQNYVLGIKSQVGQQRSDSPVIDQGLIDSLLANDANNFLVRRALDASLKTRDLQSQIAVMQERRNNMENFIKSNSSEKTEVLDQFQKSLAALKNVYDHMIHDIRLTYEDYQNQQFGDAIRISMQPHTSSFYRGLAIAGIAGLAVGMAAGLGLSLLGLWLRNKI